MASSYTSEDVMDFVVDGKESEFDSTEGDYPAGPPRNPGPPLFTFNPPQGSKTRQQIKAECRSYPTRIHGWEEPGATGTGGRLGQMARRGPFGAPQALGARGRQMTLHWTDSRGSRQSGDLLLLLEQYQMVLIDLFAKLARRAAERGFPEDGRTSRGDPSLDGSEEYGDGGDYGNSRGRGRDRDEYGDEYGDEDEYGDIEYGDGNDVGMDDMGDYGGDDRGGRSRNGKGKAITKQDWKDLGKWLADTYGKQRFNLPALGEFVMVGANAPKPGKGSGSGRGNGRGKAEAKEADAVGMVNKIIAPEHCYSWEAAYVNIIQVQALDTRVEKSQFVVLRERTLDLCQCDFSPLDTKDVNVQGLHDYLCRKALEVRVYQMELALSAPRMGGPLSIEIDDGTGAGRRRMGNFGSDSGEREFEEAYYEEEQRIRAKVDLTMAEDRVEHELRKGTRADDDDYDNGVSGTRHPGQLPHSLSFYDVSRRHSIRSLNWFANVFPCIWTILGAVVASGRVCKEVGRLRRAEDYSGASLAGLAVAVGALALCLAVFYRCGFLKLAWVSGYASKARCGLDWLAIMAALFPPVFVASRCGEQGEFEASMAALGGVGLGAPVVAWLVYRQEDLHEKSALKKALYLMVPRYERYIVAMKKAKSYESRFAECTCRAELFDLVVLLFSAAAFGLGAFVIVDGYALLYQNVFDLHGGDDCRVFTDGDGVQYTNDDYLGYIVIGCFVAAAGMGKLFEVDWDLRGPLFKAVFSLALVGPGLCITCWLWAGGVNFEFLVVLAFVLIGFYCSIFPILNMCRIR